MPPRTPVQARAHARRDAVLDAASRLIDGGADTLSVAAIARDAQIGAGTLYQYFEGVDAVVEGVVRRHLDRFDEIIVDTFAADDFDDLTTATLAVTKAFVRYYRHEPGFRALWFGPTFACRYRLLDVENNTRLIATMYDQLVERGLVPRSPRTLTYLTANWEIADTLIGLAFRLSPRGDRTVLNHLDHVLRLVTAPEPAR
jgi:AcrR family transcriptional regulator